MNDQELADKVVEIMAWDAWAYGASFAPHKFVTDWRVAGALMIDDRITALEYGVYGPRPNHHWRVTVLVSPKPNCNTSGAATAKNESLSRAIIEACCEALQRERDE